MLLKITVFFESFALTEIYTNFNTLSLLDALPICTTIVRANFAKGTAYTLEIGRAHVGTPVTFRRLVCRLLLEKKEMHLNLNKD